MSGSKTKLTGAQRQLVVGVAAIMACAVIASATYNFIIDPLTTDLNATEDQTSLLRQLPSIGALLVIFLAGVWGSRLGAKRVISISAAVMTLGYVLVMIAPGMPVVSLGMLLGSIGKQGIAVVAVSLIAARLTSKDERATGFAMLGLAIPVVYLVAPIVASLLIDNTSWRVVVGMWTLLAFCALLAARRMLPPDDKQSAAGEMWTPALAGLVLAGLVQFVSNISYEGLTAPKTIMWLVAALVALIALWQLMVRLAAPTLDLSVFRHGGFKLLLIVVALLPFSNLWYYFAVGAQNVYGYSATQAALLMVPSQVAGIAGAWFAKNLLQRLGVRIAGTVMLSGVTIALFLTVGQTVDISIIYPVLVLCLFSLAFTGGGVVMTNAIMNLAPAGKEGSASAIRGAAGAVGVAVGVVLTATIAFGAAERTVENLVSEQGGDWEQAVAIIDEIRDGTSSEEIAAQNAVSVELVSEYDAELREGLVAGYRAQGLLGGCVGLVATLIFVFNRRGLRPVGEDEGADSEPPAQRAG